RVLLEYGRLLELAADADAGDFGFREAREIDRLTEEGAARVGTRLSGDDVHHGGLARAIGSDHAAKLARVDDQREIVERLEAVEAHADAVEIQDAAMRRVDALDQDPPARCDRIVPLLARRRLAHGAFFDLSRRPASPRGRKRVTRTNSSPSANS